MTPNIGTLVELFMAPFDTLKSINNYMKENYSQTIRDLESRT